MDEVDKILTMVEEWGELIVSDTDDPMDTAEFAVSGISRKWSQISRALNDMADRISELEAQVNGRQ